jgi:DegV family protein with EDD domain
VNVKISYLDGTRYLRALRSGAAKVHTFQAELNRINVFPIPDGDTGSNIAFTLRHAVEGGAPGPSLAATSRSMAEAALTASRGNAGLIFAQFLLGFSAAVGDRDRIATRSFPELAKTAAREARQALARPVEGTILTVMDDWAAALLCLREKTGDLAELLTLSLAPAEKSLEATSAQLPVLAQNGVVDAGGKGFLIFLRGIIDLIHNGARVRLSGLSLEVPESPAVDHPLDQDLDKRYCSEAVVTGSGVSPSDLREALEAHGASVVVGGQPGRAKVHVHTDRPAELCHFLEQQGALSSIKVDDMLRQVQARRGRQAKIALVTDSACDLPVELLDRHHIHFVPIRLQIGDSTHLDKITMEPSRLYPRLQTLNPPPTTSQPPVADFSHLFTFLSKHFESIIAIHLSHPMSGTCSASRKAASHVPDTRITVIDSRHLCVSQGLIVLRAAEAIAEGHSHDRVVALVERSVAQARIYVGVRTLRYMIRGGRLSYLQGTLARLLNLKPMISVDDEGRGMAVGKAVGYSHLLRRIREKSVKVARDHGLWRYAVAHVQAPKAALAWSRDLTRDLGQEPAFILDVSPVIGLHAGPGALAVGLLPS